MGRKAVIIGAGALGLGFLAERMASDYDLCLVDTSAKTEILQRIREEQGFTVNVCSLSGTRPVRVGGDFETITNDDQSNVRRALVEADLVLTATSRKLLDGMVAGIAPAMNPRRHKGWLLFCENGRNIATSYATCFGPQTVLVDTVMSRMCRFAGPDESEYGPLWDGCDASLVVEDYGYIPLDVDLCSSGPFSSAFSTVSHEEFLCWEDVKVYLHNGVHAFVAYHAFLEGVRFFRDVPSSIREHARSVLRTSSGLGPKRFRTRARGPAQA